jgi:hypothetical protein
MGDPYSLWQAVNSLPQRISNVNFYQQSITFQEHRHQRTYLGKSDICANRHMLHVWPAKIGMKFISAGIPGIHGCLGQSWLSTQLWFGFYGYAEDASDFQASSPLLCLSVPVEPGGFPPGAPTDPYERD